MHAYIASIHYGHGIHHSKLLCMYLLRMLVQQSSMTRPGYIATNQKCSMQSMHSTMHLHLHAIVRMRNVQRNESGKKSQQVKANDIHQQCTKIFTLIHWNSHQNGYYTEYISSGFPIVRQRRDNKFFVTK